MYRHRPLSPIVTENYINTVTQLSSPSTVPAQRHTYRHCPLSQHSYTLTVTVHYPNTATHLPSLSVIRTQRHLTVTVHYPNTAICLPSLSTIPTQRGTYRYCPLSQHSDTLTVTVHYPNTATHLPSPSTIPTQLHTYRHRPLSQHIYTLTVPNSATHRHCPLSQHSNTLTVTVHYPNTATYSLHTPSAHNDPILHMSGSFLQLLPGLISGNIAMKNSHNVMSTFFLSRPVKGRREIKHHLRSNV